MKSFEYGDREIGSTDVVFGVSNMVIGFGVLTLPRTLAAVTESSDGWMSLVLGGGVALAIGWLIAVLCGRFPKMGLQEITKAVANGATANVVTSLFACYTFLFVGYETRGLANISKLYLFDRTPEEAICLFFLFVLAYGVAGPSATLLRLNVVFLPLVLLIVVGVLAMNIPFFNVHNLKPMFVTNGIDVLKGVRGTVFSFLGFEVFLFYNALNNRPETMRKAILGGLAIPFVIYLVVFVFVIGIFGSEVTKNTLYPTAELAKQVEIPGGFFERFESIFFTIWVVTLFNTAAMAFDVTVLALKGLFPGTQRMTWVIWLCPLIYLVAMQPQSVTEIDIFGEWISYAGIVIGWGLPAILLGAAKLRGVRANGRNT
ncbi:GerAB/ArcD/ProY family transporter [Cohnella cellulosilytica]|uniref:Endospore germination permease n=1 Tax=Cohnella cellulosilytica TaxID=986710 RepID=A0ABW2FAC7_9BACL